VTKRNTNDS